MKATTEKILTVEEWNRRCPVGTWVARPYMPHAVQPECLVNVPPLIARTRSVARGKRFPEVDITGALGGFPIQHLTPLLHLPRIAFAWTMPALLARAKTVTRRDWKDATVKRFPAGQWVWAIDSTYRQNKRALIEIAGTPEKQLTAFLPESEWVAEGFEWIREQARQGGAEKASLAARALRIWDGWTDAPEMLWRVPICVVAVVPEGLTMEERTERGQRKRGRGKRLTSDFAREATPDKSLALVDGAGRCVFCGSAEAKLQRDPYNAPGDDTPAWICDHCLRRLR